MTTLYVELGSAADYILLATTTVTSSGASTVTGGNIGSTGTIVGFPPATLTNGEFETTGNSSIAITDLTTAIDEITTRTNSNLIPAEIGGTTFTPGLYHSSGAVTIASNIILDGMGNYVFKINAAMSLSASVSITLLNGATADAVFWQVLGAFSMGASSSFIGTVLGSAAIGLADSSVVSGRLLTKSGALTLVNSNVSFEYSETRLAALGLETRAAIITETTMLKQFNVELPTGDTSVVNFYWGDSCDSVVEEISLDGNIWRLFHEEDEVTDENISDLIETDPNFTLRPMNKWLGNWKRIGGDNTYPVTFKTLNDSFDVEINGVFSVKFYQREFYSWLEYTIPRQLWIDETDSFISSNNSMNTIPTGSIIRLVVVSESVFNDSQLVG